MTQASDRPAVVRRDQPVPRHARRGSCTTTWPATVRRCCCCTGRDRASAAGRTSAATCRSSPEHYTTYVLDFPGFGKSYSPDANPLAVGPAAVLDFLDGMGLGPLPVIGNSMGGNVAARIAAEHPERVSRLVCIGGVGPVAAQPVAAGRHQAAGGVRREPDPRTAGAVDGVDGLRHRHPHRRVRRDAVAVGDRPGRPVRHQEAVQPADA